MRATARCVMRALLRLGMIAAVAWAAAPAAGQAAPSGSEGGAPAASTPLIRAIRLDFNNMKKSRLEVAAVEQKMAAVGVNTVALGAGRLDWTYFKWRGHRGWWSSDVKETLIDFLAQDSARFSRWAAVDAVVDVLAPRYVAAHPRTAAVSWLGKRNEGLVSTMELVNGDFGDRLVEMVDYIASHYPVISISLTELDYYRDGYGEDDKAAYLAFTHRTNWPRNREGLIDIDDPSVGAWRSHEIGRFMRRAAAAAHAHGKKLYLDVQVDWGRLELDAADHGQDYTVMLESVDRLVIWDYFGLSGFKPEYTRDIGDYLAKLGPERIILSVGLWNKANTAIPAEAFQAALAAGLSSRVRNLWITPSHFLTADHWQALRDAWAGR